MLTSFDHPATGSSSSPARHDSAATASAAKSRVKRHPIRKKTGSKTESPSSPPPSYASVAAGQSASQEQALNEDGTRQRTAAEIVKIAVIDSIIKQEDLYEVLGVKRNAKNDEIRRGFLNRSRVCHPE
jgi:hypothetical protein